MSQKQQGLSGIIFILACAGVLLVGGSSALIYFLYIHPSPPRASIYAPSPVFGYSVERGDYVRHSGKLFEVGSVTSDTYELVEAVNGKRCSAGVFDRYAFYDRWNELSVVVVVRKLGLSEHEAAEREFRQLLTKNSNQQVAEVADLTTSEEGGGLK